MLRRDAGPPLSEEDDDLLFRLAGLPYEGKWHMESVTAKKKIGKRIDGLLFRLDEPDAYPFAEFQATLRRYAAFPA